MDDVNLVKYSSNKSNDKQRATTTSLLSKEMKKKCKFLSEWVNNWTTAAGETLRLDFHRSWY